MSFSLVDKLIPSSPMFIKTISSIHFILILFNNILDTTVILIFNYFLNFLIFEEF